MELNEYAKEALRTESVVDSITGVSAPALYSAMMAMTAIGDVLDKMKKRIFYGRVIDLNALHDDIERALDSLRDLRTDAENGNITNIEQHEMFQNRTGYFTDVGPQQLALIDPRILHVVLGIATESSEIVETITNQIEGNPFDMVNLSEEIGDLNWYANGIFPDASGVPHSTYLSTNIVKLAIRYPDKFSSWLALDENRNLVEERKVLESGTK
ncbi:hypothetical protein JQ760_027960 (plasmid) [Klebsiella pneumoniae]|uniref:hypothetical protein n=1 Tax=Klebsiella pneumoniae TaxID=573 RepID=UPI001FADD835|nr:hypothetical protein [Klebsiella pneumoniae]MCI8108505.1 hypothetical protein [Klebsiella pneumoniae]